MLAADFGDAANFTSASHEAVGPQLGQLRDANAQVLNALANGDASDEDGIIFSLLRAGQSASVTVYVVNAPVGAKLDAWIDFNRDRDFTDADEQIVDYVAVVAGDNVIAFNVPATVVGGANYARFRLSTAGNLNSAGNALDGEVEDYLIPIAGTDSGIFGGQQAIAFDNVDQIALTDLDDDGDLDILNGNLKWRSKVNGRFGPETATGVTGTSQGMLAPADVDGDGDMDFFADSVGAVWYENSGTETFTIRTIDAHYNPYGMAPADLDADGDLDLVVATFNSNVFWYANDGHQVFTRMTAAIQVSDVQFVAVHDMDGDGDLDILTGAPGAIKWLENNGQQQFTVRSVGSSGANLNAVAAGDLDGDGDLDVLASVGGSSGGVTWYENDGAEVFTPAYLDATQWSASAIVVADFDADGDLDVAASGANRVAWYENDGAATFTRRIVTDVTGTYLGATAADVNGDGRLDLVTTGTGSTPLAWYEQLSETGDDYGDAPHPYRVYAQEQGPRHVATGPRLGATRDAEADGAHAPAGAEQEDDGVVFGALTLSESIGTVTVNVQNAPAGAKLDAWIDFDGDGSWGLEGEQIASSTAVVAGDNAVSFHIPSWAVPGAMYARFRLSTAGGHGPQGTALDGEVEDHAVTIVGREPATGLFGAPQPIVPGASGSGAGFMVTADVDGDGDEDVVTKSSGGFVWHENLGPLGFAGHAVAAAGISMEDITVGDLDNDGDVDFVGFGSVQGKNYLIWAENDGEQNFARRAVPFTLSASFVSLRIADLDSDGDMDVLASSLGTGVYLFVNDGRQEFAPLFIGHLGNLATSVVPADVDGDGDLDVVAGGRGYPTGSGQPFYDVGWFQNNGDLKFAWRGILRRTTSPSSGSGAIESVAVGDVDGDGDLDVVSAGVPDSSTSTNYATLWWHEQTADQGFVSHAIDFEQNYRWATLADFDVDGDLDVVAVGASIALYENVGGKQFVKRPIVAASYYSMSSSAADMDNDGDLDLVAMAVSGNGYVSWFENINLVDPDYGDLPTPYPSTRSQSGAVHNGGGPRLGSTRTSESDGTPTANADGDAGDDGVAFSPIQAGQASATVTVNVQNAPAGAKLDAWIDFNGDGSWDGGGEQIFASYPVVEGENVLTFNVPVNAAIGATGARFRLSTAGGLRVGGAARNGEVEDYLLAVAAPAPATGEYQIPATIAATAHSIRIADVDGDGDADYLTVNQNESPRLAWHENLGDGAFLTHVRSLQSVQVRDAKPVDFDRDGDVDIVATISNGLGWFENDGSQNFVYRSLTSSSLRGDFEIADLDGDGDLDAVGANFNSSTQGISILLNDGQLRLAAPILPTTPFIIHSVTRAADLDGDGDLDLVVGFDSGGSSVGIGWYENSGSQWLYREAIADPAPTDSVYGRDVVPVDFDGDGDMDLVAATYAGNGISLQLFRNDGAQLFGRETLSIFATPSPYTATVGDRLRIADLDGDGDYDAVASAPAATVVFRNHGMAGFSQAVVHQFIASTYNPVAVGDLDGDGRLEILASGATGGVVRLDDRPFGDYDRNGTVDQADRDLYEATLGQPAVPPGSGADGDRSGVVDAADLAIWEANIGAGMAPPVKAADLNQDEQIDGADFLDWQRSFGVTTTYPGMHRADLDFSATVDGGDLDVWKRHYGQGVAPPATTAVVAAASMSLATASATAMAISSPSLESRSEPLSPSPASRFALPANVILAPPAEKQFSKKPDALHLKWNSTAPRDAAFAALAPPAAVSLRHQRLQPPALKPVPASDATHVRIDAALDDEFLTIFFDR